MFARAAAALALALPLTALAAPDPAEGRRLVAEHKCEACHQRKARGPEGAIYLRKNRIVTSWPKLKSQVALCGTELNLGLFPEDEEAIAAFLDATYYRFGGK